MYSVKVYDKNKSIAYFPKFMKINKKIQRCTKK